MREELGDLALFMAVAEARSFTRAAAQLDLSQSAVSHAVRRLEASVGIKLLNRTSRRVSTTDAGEKLLAALRPGLGMISSRIEELRLLGDAPKGLVRLATSKPALRTILWPKLSQIVRDYPEIQIELNLESRLTDLAAERFDAGVRLREFVGPDMIAVKIGPPIRLAAVATPHYFQTHGTPAHPDDLDHHACLVLRFHAHAPVYDWEFEKDGEEIVKKVSGPFIFSESDICIEAAKAGHGIAFVTEQEVIKDIENGALRRVLADWCPPFDGYHLCYSGRRNISSAFRLVIDRLKYDELATTTT
ncbi:HTH-type transcriptional regulator YcjZ [Alcanivorax sp. S71-1-4]|uniref:LysR family transcriptional regulator n=1 Tax=Alcanivorax sp. S71-1-4 TaxID=1177159 RepID=UPI00135A680B|nr:LysR family transcriptional regulator [Alcanivorax sp. S71-1-4]KAF0810315.1 HTH-type transcriptional regulator YcjZ [Alcanivorax sp. S71-1-4]